MGLVQLLVAATSLVSSTYSASIPRATSCNGSPELCDRKYSNASLIGTHNSAFVGEIIDPRVNQEKSVTEQLDAGIRFLQAQVHEIDIVNELSMCHTSCWELYAGSLKDYASTVKSWLDNNPDEVLTMLLANGDNSDVSKFDDVLSDVELKDYAFAPSTSPDPLAKSDWPTYGDLISSGKRLVLFMDYEADTTKVDYILPEWDYFFETPFDVTDAAFGSCAINRPPDASPDGRMYIVNHFLDKEVFDTGILIPDSTENFDTNAATGDGSIGAQANLCEGQYGREPNAVLVDMFHRGDVFAAQRALNGL